MSAAAIAQAFPGVLRTVRPANVKLSSGVNVAAEDPVLLSGFYSLAAANPSDAFTITSGARSKQPASGPYPIAEQGHSLHDPTATGTGTAEAIDAVVNGQPIGSAFGVNELGMFGLHLPVPGDPVHVTLEGWNG